MATIREVAKLAGVSPATVSRVMNGTANVDDDKKNRVLEAIEKTGFQPNQLARALFKNSSRLVGLIVPNIDNPFFSELARKIEEEAFKRGYQIVLCSSGNNSDKELSNIRMLSRMKADGIILITNGEHTGKMIKETDLPVVVVDRHMTDGGEIAYIESDHYTGGVLATEHLYECGCRKIVCLRGPQEYASGRLRFKGYQDVCRKYGLEEMYIDTAYTFEAGLKSAELLMEKYPEADGIFAANDIVAISTYKVLKNHKIKVPKDVKLVGFDDIRFSSLMTPELTTIRQPIGKMGELAVDIICNYAEGEPYDEACILGVELVKRETTK
ncbi:transcriptional regulator, LacI family [Oribacterium sp. KHPX15]|uniref:LacI family DNA-binding transcriptional regulator n=1 Tax=Oribacterium sp. KHPX15 TaxID=1855342 RepID=UPI00089A6669|nr:LacI family DNA-binding transcriptional regulator [Oribacterium sp. KHPX15]SEA77631.1 transcriptional regulator, LacI family [Oribacterium sp. KHPX15]